MPETQQEQQQEEPATAQTTAGDSSSRHFKLTLWKPVSDEDWAATHTQPDDGETPRETQSTATLSEFD